MKYLVLIGLVLVGCKKDDCAPTQIKMVVTQGQDGKQYAVSQIDPGEVGRVLSVKSGKFQWCKE